MGKRNKEIICHHNNYSCNSCSELINYGLNKNCRDFYQASFRCIERTGTPIKMASRLLDFLSQTQMQIGFFLMNA